MRKPNLPCGFTLIELIIVLCYGVLAALVVPTLGFREGIKCSTGTLANGAQGVFDNLEQYNRLPSATMPDGSHLGLTESGGVFIDPVFNIGG